jgi:hypothetical protein
MTSNPSCVKALLLVALSAAVAGGQTHTLVSIGDHRLDVVRAGEGGPAVVFETGLADSLDVWLPMLRTISEYTTVNVAGIVLVDGTHEQQVQRFGTVDSAYPREFLVYYDSVLARLAPGAEAAEIRETVRIQARGAVPGLQPLPDIPIAVLTSMRSDESSQYVNGTARGHEVWRALHDEWFRRSRNGIHIETARSGHGIQDDEPALVAMAIRFVLDRVRAQ